MRTGRTNMIRNHLADMKLRPREIKALALDHTANECVCDYFKILGISAANSYSSRVCNSYETFN